MRSQGVIERWRKYLPLAPDTRVVTLNEGATPLIAAPDLARAIHPRIELWLKFEGLNPTGSFKDRGMTVAVTKAVEEKYRTIMCASTGNTSASAAAYAARAGLECIVLIPEGNIAHGKLSQALIHGAKVLQIDANFDRALELVRAITDSHPIALVNSLNPNRIEGQKTGAFEIVEAFEGVAPDFHALPVGNAGNIYAYWKGYKEYRTEGKSQNLPRMLGFQAAGAAPIVLGHAVDDPQTFASAICVGRPASWERAVEARDESDGVIGMVTDRQIKGAYRKLAAMEGVFAEPASAASIAGLFKLSENGFFDDFKAHEGDRIRIVCVLTGHGLKDPENAVKLAAEPISVEANEEAVLKAVDVAIKVPT